MNHDLSVLILYQGALLYLPYLAPALLGSLPFWFFGHKRARWGRWEYPTLLIVPFIIWIAAGMSMPLPGSRSDWELMLQAFILGCLIPIIPLVRLILTSSYRRHKVCLIALLSITALILSLELFDHWRNSRPFDATQWRNKTTRMRMVRDLSTQYPLIGKSEQQVTELLGPPEQTLSFNEFQKQTAIGQSLRVLLVKQLKELSNKASTPQEPPTRTLVYELSNSAFSLNLSPLHRRLKDLKISTSKVFVVYLDKDQMTTNSEVLSTLLRAKR